MGKGPPTATGGEGVPAPVALAEIELRRYEARLGVWKVVLGTFIVGLAGIIIPAAINMTTLVFENWQKEARFQLEKQTAHQQYIKDFFDTAVNQDVELRIRFANYFANLSDGEQRALWQGYLETLISERNASRERINTLEAELVSLQQVEQTAENVTRLDWIARELNWTYAEIGYVALDRGTVQVVPGKKERLYQETMQIIRTLVVRSEPVDPDSVEYQRFWELHDRDLIGIESRAVARAMIAFGRELKRLAAAGEPRNRDLRQQAVVIMRLMNEELDREANANGSEQRISTLQQVISREAEENDGMTREPLGGD